MSNTGATTLLSLERPLSSGGSVTNNGLDRLGRFRPAMATKTTLYVSICLACREGLATYSFDNAVRSAGEYKY